MVFIIIGLCNVIICFCFFLKIKLHDFPATFALQGLRPVKEVAALYLIKVNRIIRHVFGVVRKGYMSEVLFLQI